MLNAGVITHLVSARRASELRWKVAFENNPTMYFMVDPAGTVIAVNSFGAEQLGYSVAELAGQPVLNVFLDDDKTAASAHVERCLATFGVPLSWELRKIRKDGSMLWVRETARAVRLGGKLVVLIACEDITPRREAEERLRENEHRLRAQAGLLDLAHDAIFVRDLDGVIAYWSRGAEELYGWAKHDAVGSVSHELLKTTFPGALSGINATLLETGRWEGELRHTKRDGTEVLVASRWSLRRDEGGSATGVLVTNRDITQAKRAEERLRRSEMYLAEAQRLSHTGSFGWDVTAGTAYWSDETYRIYGIDPGTPPNPDVVLQYTHPDDRAQCQATIMRAQREFKDYENNYRLLLPDGSLKHIHVVAHALVDNSGRREFIGAVMDVSAQKEAEEERRSYLRFLESMDRVNRAMQGTSDIEQMIRDVFDVAISIFDCERALLVHPCDPDASEMRVAMARTRPDSPQAGADPDGMSLGPDNLPIVQAVLRAPGPVRFDATTEPPLRDEMRRRSGAQSVLGMAIHPKGDAPYLFALIQYSHARAWTDQEERLFQEIGRRLADALTTLLVLRDLRESSLRYQNIFQTAAVSIWEEDFSEVEATISALRAQGVENVRHHIAEHPEFVLGAMSQVRVVDVNDATISLFGARTKAELLGSLDKIVTPATRDVFVESIVAVAERHTIVSVATQMKSLAGERLDVLLTFAFPPAPAKLDRVLVVIMDVTARKRAEEALQRAQLELSRVGALTTMGELAVSITHELRQPLAAIAMDGSAALRWLGREPPNLDEARDAATRTVRNAQRADEVIRGLRALLGNRALRPQTLQINDMIHEVLELVAADLRANDIVARTDVATSLPPISGDRLQLQQVMLNLIANSIEAMTTSDGRPRELTLRAENAGVDGLAITVADTGRGFDAATAAHLFDPFFTTKPGGLGLGLSICRSIVEAHGGRLYATPRVPHGASFRFTIPGDGLGFGKADKQREP